MPWAPNHYSGKELEGSVAEEVPANSSKSEKSPRKPKVSRKRYVPEVPVAQTGFWGWLWKLVSGLYSRTGWGWLIVQPSVREWKAGIGDDVNHKQLKTLTCNKKGGTGKTPVATATGAILAWVTQRYVMLIDANQTRGNTDSRVGVENSYSVRSTIMMLRRRKRISHAWADQHYGHHPAPGYGSLIVMSSDDETQWDEPLELEEVLNLFKKSKEEIHSHVIDLGNTIGNVLTMAAMQYIDVPMFVCRERFENSVDDCLQTIRYYRRTMPEKVENGVVVVVGWRHGDSSVEDYAKTFEFPKKRIILIPDDPFYEAPKVKSAKPSNGLIKVFTAEQLKRKTLKAYFRLIRLLFELTPEYVDEPNKMKEENGTGTDVLMSQSAATS